MRKPYDPEDSFDVKRYLSYLSDDYDNRKITLDKYMAILENHSEFLDSSEKQRVKEWRDKKDKDLADKKSKKLFKKKQDAKDSENAMLYFFVVLSLIVLIFMALFGKK